MESPGNPVTTIITEALEKKQENNQALWSALLEIANSKPNQLYTLCNQISLYIANFPLFIEKSNEYTKEITDKLENDDVSSEEKITLTKNLAKVAQYFNNTVATTFISALISITNNELAKSSELPKTISIIEQLDFSSIQKDVFGAFYEKIKQEITPASVYIFAPIAVDIVQAVPECYNTVNDIVVQYLAGDANLQAAGAFLCERTSELNLPPETLEPLINLLTSPEKTVMFRAHKAVRALIASGSFDIDYVLPAAFEHSEEYSGSNVRLLFKLAEAAIDTQEEELNFQFAKAILELASPLAKKADTSFRGGFLDLFCAVVAGCPDAAAPYAAIASMVGVDLAAKSAEPVAVSVFVLAAAKSLSKQKQTAKDRMLPFALASISNKELSLKQRLLIAENIAACSQDYEIDAKEIQKIAMAVVELAPAATGPKAFYVLSPARTLSSIVDDATALQLFNAIAAKLDIECGFNQTNAILETLYSLMKHVPESAVLEVAQKIATGNIACLNGEKPYIATDESNLTFYFIRKAAKHCPTVRGLALSLLTEGVLQCSPSLLADVLGIAKGLSYEGTDGQKAAETVFSAALQRLKALHRSEEDGLCACLEALAGVLSRCPTAFDAPSCLSVLAALLFESETEADNEEEEEADANYGFAAMVRLALSIFAAGMGEGEEFLTAVVGLLPFDAQLADAMVPVYDSLADIATRPELAFVHKTAAAILAEPLALPKAERTAEGVEGPLFEKMRAALGGLLKAQKGLDKELTRGWARAKLNRFSSLFK